MRKLRAAVIGLGRVGLRFDEEPGRKTVWSHVGAYLAEPGRFELVAACEPNPDNRAAFGRRCPGVPVFDDARTMIAETDPEIVSVCTPPELHVEGMVTALSGRSIRAIWCEKPLAGTLGAAEEIAAAAARRGVPVYVSHVRRWTPLWREMRRLVEAGAIGDPVCIRIAMGNRLWTIGSHAVDLALMLGGKPREVERLPVKALDEDGEPGRAGLISFESGAYGIIQVVGRKSRLVVEAEVIGTRGRLGAHEGSGRLTVESFAPSETYAGYEELRLKEERQLGTLATMSPFVALARDIAAAVPPACTANDAVAVISVLELMAA